VLVKQNRGREAEPFYREMLEQTSKRLGEKHPSRVAGLLSYAIYHRNGNRLCA